MERGRLSILLSGSIAFDYIMNFPGYFEDHILPDKIHMLNVSFLVESLDRQQGGIAGNIAYSLGLLGQKCRVVGPVGEDFDDYGDVLEELGVDLSGIWRVEGAVTASAFITTDRADNQITGFYPGAMARAGEVGLDGLLDGITLAVISPTAPEAMERHVKELRESNTPYVYDPGQQIISLSPDALRAGVDGARIVIGNDYEFAMIQEKTNMSREEIIEKVPTVVITFGDLGSTIHSDGKSYEVPSASARTVVDPTGAGDAYRAGLISGLNSGLSWDAAGRVASMAATFAVEHRGTQAHRYTHDEFRSRFSEMFPDYTGALDQLFGNKQVV